MMRNHQALALLLFLSPLLFSALSADGCHPNDRKALLQINKAFNNAFASWNPNIDCCTWHAVNCSSTTNRVSSLLIMNNDKVAGTIPDAVGDLPHLEKLAFAYLPKLTGPIPQAIARLKTLTAIWIGHTNVSGSIPNFLSQLTELYYISLAVNKLTGPIPPWLSNLPKLEGLFLERNQFTGSIPESFGGFKNKLFYLNLAKNQLSGPIPRSLGAVNLLFLDLSKNHKLTGDASFLFEENKILDTVDLSRNQLSFNITNVVFPKTLTYLDLSHNKIYGTLPPSLAKLPSLSTFNVSYNQLSGPIPTGGQLVYFDQYSFARNKGLCGNPLPNPCHHATNVANDVNP